MKTNTLIGIAAIIIVAVLAYLLFTSTRPAAENTDTSSAMLAEESAVVVMEQKPGTSVTASLIVLKSPGFLVIHEDNNGAPGAILGASALLQAGESSMVEVALSRATRDGESLHAMLHTDADASGAFSASSDTPVQSKLGGPISGWFLISASASEKPPAVSI